MQKILSALGALLLVAGAANAETTVLDPVVVTATRTATSLSRIGNSVTVITSEEIEEKQQNRVADVLRSVPGINIVQNGPLGSQTSLHMRGTDNKHVLILIDGIEFRDASTVGGGADLADISTDNIDRIEIVRGAQSVIYGSDAIGGVVNIITKKGSRTPQGYASVEGGSYNTWRESAGFSAGSENTRTAFTVSRSDSDGFSAYNEEDGFDEEDGYASTNVSFNIGADLNEFFTLNMNLRLADSENEFDTYDATFARADTDAETDSLEIAGRTEGIFSLFDGQWQLALGSNITDTSRTTTGTYDNYEYNGRVTKFDLQNTVELSEKQTLVVGLETEKEEYDSSYGDSGDVRNQAVFIQDQLFIGDFAVAVGARIDDHQEFGAETTWRVAPAYTLPATGTQLKASAATGFKAPSLYQLYAPFYGNQDLDPETSTSFDFGIEQPLFDNSLILGVAWFQNKIDDYIGYDFSRSQYYNIAELTTSGIESTADWYPCEFFDAQLAYTYTDSEDENGARKARIPLHKGALNLNVYPLDRTQFNVNILYVGAREDGAADETLDAYTLVNLAASYELTENLKLFGRIDNLFDKDYEEVAGYGTAGLSAYAGIKASF